MLEKAIDLATRYGFFVFPLQPKAKEPAIMGPLDRASCVPEEIRALWQDGRSRHGNCLNIGILMGRRSGILGLDYDLNHGADPNGLNKFPLAPTVRSANGFHLFYRIPKTWEGVDFGTLTLVEGKPKEPCVTIRMNRHYFVAAGSTHPSGVEYRWLKNQGQHDEFHGDCFSPDEIALSDAPDFFLEALNAHPDKQPATAKEYFAGARHKIFLDTAVAMRKEGRGSTLKEIVDRLTERNLRHCNPPKENCDAEISRIAAWALASISPVSGVGDGLGTAGKTLPAEDTSPQPIEVTENEPSIFPLGVKDRTYYFTSTYNRQILPFTSLTPSHLLEIMPLEYWTEKFGTPALDKDGADLGFKRITKLGWLQAEDHMRGICLQQKIYNPKNIKGRGAWNDNGKLVLHLGDRLLVDSRELDLSSFKSRYIYKLEQSHPSPHGLEANLEECQVFLEACKAPKWKNPRSSLLLAGLLSLGRLAGALPWRPHGWLTGQKGSGKTALIDCLVHSMLGPDWVEMAVGGTTEAGIRQTIKSDSRPIVFDESEFTDARGRQRIVGVLLLARAASSESEARSLKGSAAGKAQEYRMDSMFILSSINTALQDPADSCRFVELEINLPDKNDSRKEYEAKLFSGAKLSEKIFRRMLNRYEDILANYELLNELIAKDLGDHRAAQTYGMVLAGVGILRKDSALNLEEASALIAEAAIEITVQEKEEVSNQNQFLDYLLTSKVRTRLSDTDNEENYTLEYLIDKSIYGSYSCIAPRLERLGFRVIEEGLVIRAAHADLQDRFKDTPWQDNWKQPIKRLGGSSRVFKFEKRATKGYLLPWRVINPTLPEVVKFDL